MICANYDRLVPDATHEVSMKSAFRFRRCLKTLLYMGVAAILIMCLGYFIHIPERLDIILGFVLLKRCLRNFDMSMCFCQGKEITLTRYTHITSLPNKMSVFIYQLSGISLQNVLKRYK